MSAVVLWRLDEWPSTRTGEVAKSKLQTFDNLPTGPILTEGPNQIVG